MRTNAIIAREFRRGAAGFRKIRAAGREVPTEVRSAMKQLLQLKHAADSGAVLEASATKVAGRLAGLIHKAECVSRNGRVLGLAERLNNSLAVSSPVKTLVAGLMLMFGSFIAGGILPVSNSLLGQLLAVAMTGLILGAHSLICAGVMVENQSAGFFRAFLAWLVVLTPLFGGIAVWDASQDEIRAARGIVYDLRFMSLFFLQGVVAAIFWLIGHKNISSTSGDSVFDPTESLSTRHSIVGTDPNLYHDLGYHSDLSQL